LSSFITNNSSIPSLHSKQQSDKLKKTNKTNTREKEGRKERKKETLS
jgi:hypothetical protein